MNGDELYEQGMQTRRAVLGITRFAWGGVWTRGVLDHRTRSAITLSVLTALGREQGIGGECRLRNRTAGLRRGLNLGLG